MVEDYLKEFVGIAFSFFLQVDAPQKDRENGCIKPGISVYFLQNNFVLNLFSSLLIQEYIGFDVVTNEPSLPF